MNPFGSPSDKQEIADTYWEPAGTDNSVSWLAIYAFLNGCRDVNRKWRKSFGRMTCVEVDLVEHCWPGQSSQRAA
jgi:hypothetical protein